MGVGGDGGRLNRGLPMLCVGVGVVAAVAVVFVFLVLLLLILAPPASAVGKNVKY